MRGVTDVAVTAEQVERGRGRPGGVQPAPEAVRQVAPVPLDRLQLDGRVELLRPRRGDRSGRRRRRGAGRRVTTRASTSTEHARGVAGVDELGDRPAGRASSGRTACRSPGTAARRGRRPRRCRAARRTVPRQVRGREGLRRPALRPGAGLGVVVDAVGRTLASENIDGRPSTAAGPRCWSRALRVGVARTRYARRCCTGCTRRPRSGRCGPGHGRGRASRVPASKKPLSSAACLLGWPWRPSTCRLVRPAPVVAHRPELVRGGRRRHAASGPWWK